MSRLLVFTENYHVPSGGASYVVDLCNALADVYDDMVLASNSRGFAPDTSQRVQAPHIQVDVPICTAAKVWTDCCDSTWLLWRGEIGAILAKALLRLDRLVFAHNVRVLRRLIRTVQPSAVLAFNGGYPAGHAVLSMVVAARLEGTPVALTVVSVPATRPSGALGRWETRMDAAIGRAADVIVVNASAIGEALIAERGLPCEKIEVIHNSLPDRPVPAPRESEGRLRIGCVSRIDHLKGTRYLVEAFAMLSQSHPDAELVIVGDGPEREAVERLTVSLGVRERVVMAGHYEGDVDELVATFTIYAFPSLWEGLPYALLEAMRMGRPIVATDVGGISEAIVDDKTGLLVPPASADALAAAIKTLADDEGLRHRLGAAARAFFEDSFSLDAMHERAIAVFGAAGLTEAGDSR